MRSIVEMFIGAVLGVIVGNLIVIYAAVWFRKLKRVNK